MENNEAEEYRIERDTGILVGNRRFERKGLHQIFGNKASNPEHYERLKIQSIKDGCFD